MVTGRNSLQRQSYLKDQRPCRFELQVFLAREVAPVKDPVLRDTRGLDGSP
jgi:hypothetical protein